VLIALSLKRLLEFVVNSIGVLSDPQQDFIQYGFNAGQFLSADPEKFLFRNFMIKMHHAISVTRHFHQELRVSVG
jgi:hypothetical protein